MPSYDVPIDRADQATKRRRRDSDQMVGETRLLAAAREHGASEPGPSFDRSAAVRAVLDELAKLKLPRSMQAPAARTGP